MSEQKIFQVSVSPHVRNTITTQKIMLMVILALLPSAVFGVLNFGISALVILLVSILCAVAAEWIYEKALKKKSTISDLSAVVTGLLIGMNMPPEIAPWIPGLGSVFAIIVVKQLYGGLGQNFMNPALGARCFLLISFSAEMTNYHAHGGIIPLITKVEGAADALSGATPLAYLKQGMSFGLKPLFLGNVEGVIGETSALFLFIGGMALLAMKIIDWKIPVLYIGSFALLVLVTAAIRGYAQPLLFTAEEICAGGLMLGAWFMATDYVTSPITPNGRILYALFLGVMTWIFRMIGNSAEGVSYSILLGNLLTPLIESVTRPRAFGVVKQKKGAEKA